MGCHQCQAMGTARGPLGHSDRAGCNGQSGGVAADQGAIAPVGSAQQANWRPNLSWQMRPCGFQEVEPTDTSTTSRTCEGHEFRGWLSC